MQRNNQETKKMLQGHERSLEKDSHSHLEPQILFLQLLHI